MPSSRDHSPGCEFARVEPADIEVATAENAVVGHQLLLLLSGERRPSVFVEQSMARLKALIGPSRTMAALACANCIAHDACPVFRSFLSLDKTTALILERRREE